MHQHALLETHLKQLRLPTFLAHYQQIAQDAARTDLPYERFPAFALSGRTGAAGGAPSGACDCRGSVPAAQRPVQL